MNKVLIFRHATAIGGAERYLLNLIEQSKGEIDYTVITNFPPLESELRRLGVETKIIPYSWEPFGRKAVIKFYLNQSGDRKALVAAMRAVFRGQKGTVFCHSLTDKLLVSSSARQQGLKVVWLEHGPMVGRLLKYSFLKKRYYQASLSAHQIICVSQTTANNIATTGVDRTKLKVIYNGTPAIAANQPANRKVLRLVTTNRLVPEKGYVELLAALASLTELSWVLDIVADGPFRSEIEHRARALGLNERIIFHGFQADVRPFLVNADIFVNPTIYPAEGLPIANIEALAASLPVVTSNYGGAIETVEDKISGLLVDPTAGSQLALALKAVLTDTNLRQRLSKAGKVRWQKLFSLDGMVEQTLAIIR